MDKSKAKSVFSADFISKARYSTLENKIYVAIIKGANPYQLIESLCAVLNETNERLVDIVTNGPQPQIIVTTKEELDQFKKID